MAYNGRRGPNISQFLRELHENPTLVENDPAFSMDDQDLSMFTNTEFFDLETGQNTDFQPQPQAPAKPLSESASSSSAVSPLSEETMTTMTDFANIDFMATAGKIQLCSFLQLAFSVAAGVNRGTFAWLPVSSRVMSFVRRMNETWISQQCEISRRGLCPSPEK